jgi:hypothetical protein
MAIEREAAQFLVDVATALDSVKSGKTSYGEFYVSEAVVGFDGEDTSYRVVANEHGGYDIEEGQK